MTSATEQVDPIIRSRFTDPLDAARGWRFLCRSGQLCLDFTATLAGVGVRDQERLADEELFREWLTRVGLPPVSGEVTEADLVRTRAFREAVYRIAVSNIEGVVPRKADVTLLNRQAKAGAPVDLLGEDGHTLVRSSASSMNAILALIARDAIDLFTGEHHDRVRACGHELCTLLFVDRSRAGNRRWCAMSPCGDKVSARNYRRRAKEDS